MQLVVVGTVPVAVVLVAHKQLLNGDGVPSRGSAYRLFHALNLAVLVHQEHAEVVGLRLAHQFLHGLDNLLLLAVHTSGEIHGVRANHDFDAVQRIVTAAIGAGVATVVAGSLDERTHNNLSAVGRSLQRSPRCQQASLTRSSTVNNAVAGRTVIKTLKDDFLDLPEVLSTPLRRNSGQSSGSRAAITNHCFAFLLLILKYISPLVTQTSGNFPTAKIQTITELCEQHSHKTDKLLTKLKKQPSSAAKIYQIYPSSRSR